MTELTFNGIQAQQDADRRQIQAKKAKIDRLPTSTPICRNCAHAQWKEKDGRMKVDYGYCQHPSNGPPIPICVSTAGGTHMRIFVWDWDDTECPCFMEKDR